MNNTDLNRKAFKSGVWYLLSTIILKAISFITIPLFSRLLTTSEFGIFSIYNTWASILTVILSLNLSYSIGRAKFDYPDDLDRYIGSMHLLSLINTTIVIFIVTVTRVDVAGLLGLAPQYLVFVYLYILFEPAITYHQIAFRYQYKSKENVIISFVISLGSIICSFAFIYLLFDNAMARIVGSLVPVVILGFIFWIDILKKKTVTINQKYWKYGLALSIPLIFHKLSLHLLSQADRIVINNYCGSSDTGIYSLVYQYGSIISIIMTAVSDAWLPWFHDMMDINNYQEIKRKVKPLLEIACTMGLVSVCISPEMVMILGGVKYMSGIYVAPPVILGVVTQYMYTQYVNIEMNLKRTRIIAVSTMIAAVINIGLNLLFIPIYGFVAAAYTTLAGYMILFAIHCFNIKIIYKVQVYDDKHLFVLLFLTVIIGLLVQFTYSSYTIRYLICILAFLTCGIKNKSYIVPIIKRLFCKR